MMKFFRLSALVAASVVLAVSAGCSLLGADGSSSAVSGQNPLSSADSSVKTDKSILYLPVGKGQPLSPFATSTMVNYTIWPLMYDCLYEPDQNFDAVNGLAVAMSNSGTTATVQINTNVRFTDGSQLTPADVVYSFNLVLSNHSSVFYQRVANIQGVTSPAPNIVVFTLHSPDALIKNVLDIPIIKANSDKKGALPVGTGRYKYAKYSMGGLLSVNKGWYGGKTPFVQKIYLVNMPDSDSITRSFNVGMINYLFTDYGNGNKSNINGSSQDINLNQLVFLGISTSNAALGNAHLRRALSLIIDRTTLEKEVYSSHALPTCFPFNPAWSGAPKLGSTQLFTDQNGAKKELSAAGFTAKDSNGMLYGTQQGRKLSLSFKLLVNKDDTLRVSAAQKIAVMLKNYGINISVDQKDFNSYCAAIQASNFDLYIGEIKLNYDMDLSPFFVSGGSVSYGHPKSNIFYSQFLQWQAGKENIDAVCSSFETETPFIPLCFKNGAVSYTPDFYKNLKATGHDIFLNIQDWQS